MSGREKITSGASCQHLRAQWRAFCGRKALPGTIVCFLDVDSRTATSTHYAARRTVPKDESTVDDSSAIP
jgi:hypothetical protein